MELNLQDVEDACKELYIRALKLLPDDVKQGINRLKSTETDARAQVVLGTMVTNIAVAEREDNLLCQDTGLPIYNVWIGRGVRVDGVRLKEAIRKGCERATTEYPLRSSVVHPITRKNNHTSSGIEMPAIHIDFMDKADTIEIEMIPKGSGSENNSFLKMAIPAEGIDAIKINKVLEGRPHIEDAIRNRQVQLVINTTDGNKAISDSKSLRRAALMQKVPYYTTMAGAMAAAEAIDALKKGQLEVAPLQSYF